MPEEDNQQSLSEEAKSAPSAEQVMPEKPNPEDSLAPETTTPNPTAGTSTTPEVSKLEAPSTAEPEATNMATGSGTAAPPEDVNPDINPNAAASKDSAAPLPKKTVPKESPEGTSAGVETQPEKSRPAAAKAKPEGGEETDQKPAAKAAGDKKPKKEKPPAVEDKPFTEFIQQDYLPALEKTLAANDLDGLQLSFEGNQVKGCWNHGNKEFIVYFPKADINETKGFSVATKGRPPSTIEPFLIDERRITLDLLVFGVVQRLNGQKWLGNN